MTSEHAAAPPEIRFRLAEGGSLLAVLALAALGLPWLAGVGAVDSLRLALPPALLLLGCWWLGRRNMRDVRVEMPGPVTDFEFTATVATLRLHLSGRRATHDLLVHHGDGAVRRPVLYVATLQGDATRHATIPLRLPGRGRQRHHGLTLRSSWPLGLVQWEAAYRVPTELLALPRLGELRNADALMPVRGTAQALDPVQLGEAEEFHALKEWRPGMSQRRVHWKSSARFGRLMLRETRSERKPRIHVHLAPPTPSADGAASPLVTRMRRVQTGWETSIRLTATITEWFLRQDYQVTLSWSGEEPFLIRLEAGRRGLFRALGALAALPRDPQPAEASDLHASRGTLPIVVAAGGGHRLEPGRTRLDPLAPDCDALFRLERRLAPRARMEVSA